MAFKYWSLFPAFFLINSLQGPVALAKLVTAASGPMAGGGFGTGPWCRRPRILASGPMAGGSFGIESKFDK